jgi:hypothetical protein
MIMKSQFSLPVLAALLSAVTALPAALATPKSADQPGMATMTVTAVGKDGSTPSVTKDDIQLTQGNERKQIASWTKGEKLYLAILIDDSLDSGVAGQWGDLKEFINEQPASTSIAVGYAANSTVFVAQDFTSDHALAAKALRIPRGYYAAGSSPYLSVIDWMKRWPATGDRRSLLLVSSGIDFFRGGFEPIYPDVDTAISIAQKGNINLWSIFYPGAGHYGRSFFLLDRGQINMSKMTLETGGESFYLGYTAPVAFKPYLDELSHHLANQYLLSFAGDGGAKGKLVNVHLKTELSGVEFMYPNQAYLPPSK